MTARSEDFVQLFRQVSSSSTRMHLTASGDVIAVLALARVTIIYDDCQKFCAGYLAEHPAT